MKKYTAVNAKARKLAAETGWKPVSTSRAISTIREIRVDLRSRGIPDHCYVVAGILNDRKLLRGWYRGGEMQWTRFDVRDVWFRRYGRQWTDWSGKRLTKARTKPPRTPRKAKQRLSWYCTPNYISRQAKKYCEKHPGWHVLPSQEFIDLVKGEFYRGQTSGQIAAMLNRRRCLRPNYLGGNPKWSQSRLSNIFKAMNGGAGLRELMKQPDPKQIELKLPVKTTEMSDMEWIAPKPEDLKFDPISATVTYRETCTFLRTIKVDTDEFRNLQRRLKS